MQASNDSEETKFARHWQFEEREKNSDYLTEYFPFEIFFQRKIVNYCSKKECELSDRLFCIC